MKYGFIGCGNMGGAIAALSKTTHDMALTDRSGKSKTLAEKLGCTYLEARNFRSAVMECVCATYQRNLELGK